MAPHGVAATGSYLSSGAGACLCTHFSFVAGGSSGALAKVLGDEIFLLEGVTEEPLQQLLLITWLGRKASPSYCLADDDYVTASYTSLEASLKSPCALVK
jgi:hypothetical protein